MKTIKTTYMMCDEVQDLLLKAQEKTGWEWARLVLAVMRMMLRNHNRLMREHGRIEYQKRYDETSGMRIKKIRVKVKLQERDYDYFQDMRKIFRRSISLIIAIAVKYYLHELVERIINGDYDEEVDSYPYKNYAIIEKCIDGITTFRIWWGLPADPELLL